MAGMSSKNLMNFAADAAVIGTAGAVSVAATDYAFDRWSKSVGYNRAAMQGGLHIALGAGIAALGMPKIGAGVAVGGVVSAVEDAITWGSADEAQRAAMKAAQEARVAARQAQYNNASQQPAAGSSTSTTNAGGAANAAGSSSGLRGLPAPSGMVQNLYADRPRVAMG